jgi:Mrp family chromosome partitioning ATPase
MKKILFAIGHKSTEDAISKKLNEDQFKICGIVTYKGGIIKQIEEKRPDILVIRENLKGSEDMLSVTYEVRTQFPSVRIIVLADAASPQNKTLATLVSWGIYDIISGKTIKLMNIIDLIEKPRTLKDMSKYKLVNLPFNPPSEIEEALKENKEDEKNDKKGFFNRFKKSKDDETPKNPFLNVLVEKESKISENKEKIEELKKGIKEKEEKLDILTKEKNILKEKYNKIDSDFLDKDSKVTSLRTEVLDLEEKIEELDKDLLSLKEQKQVLEHDLEVKSKESVSLNLKIEGLKKEFDELPDTSFMVKEKERLEKLISEKKKSVGSLKESNIKRKELLNNLTDEIKKLSHTNENLKEKIGLNKEELENLKEKKERELSLKKEKYQSVINEIGEVERKVSDLEGQIRVKEEVLQDSKTKLNSSKNNSFIDYDLSPENKKTITFKDKVNPNDVLKEYDEFKVIAFMGAKHGVGCSTIALNTAALLSKKNKVLYIEVNEKFPLSSYLFELLNITNGLEYAVDYAVKGKSGIISEEILKTENKNVPKNLDFLTFSNSYLINEKSQDLTPFSSKGLGLLLEKIKEQLDYDLVVLDLQPDENEISEAVLSKKLPINYLFMVLSQDVHSIGSACYKKEQLKYSDEDINYETTYLVNKYDDSFKLKVKNIAKWIDVNSDSILPVLFDEKILMDLNYEGKFYSLETEKGFGLGEILLKIK